MAKTTEREKDGERYLVKRVQQLGGIVRKVRWLDRPGAPDRFVAFPEMRVPVGRVVPAEQWFVEMKAPDGSLKPHQAREIERLRKVGVGVKVLYGIDDVKAWLG